MAEADKVEIPMTDINQITRAKNRVISDIQEFYRGYLAITETIHDMKVMHEGEARSQLDALKGSELTLSHHLDKIKEQEDEIRDLRKSKNEYEVMIRDLQDKLHEKQNADAEEVEQSNKFSMMRLQAKEITEKDREIERLNRLLLLHKNKNKKQESTPPLDGGWSPTRSQTPRQEENVEDVEDVEIAEGDTNDETHVIDNVLSSVSESVLRLERVVSTDTEEPVEEAEVEPVEETVEVAEEEEEVAEEEVAEEEVAEEEVEEEEEEEEVAEEEEVEEITYEEITYRKKKYLYDPNDATQKIYECTDGSQAGKVVGTWGTTKSGRKKPLLDK